MQKTLVAIGVATLFIVASLGADEAVRQMNVTMGPETVFERPPPEFLPSLAGARQTGQNGRVGLELVFWGYQQPDGRQPFFFACAQLDSVDCPQRVQQICGDATTTVLETQQATGNVVHRSCRAVATAAIGDRRPGCDDHEQEDAGLLIGLVTCG